MSESKPQAPKQTNALATNSTSLPLWTRVAVYVLGLAFSVLTFRVAGFGVFEETILRPSAVIAALLLVILSRPLWSQANAWYGKRLSVALDVAMLGLSVFVLRMATGNFEHLKSLSNFRFDDLTTLPSALLLVAAAISILYFSSHAILVLLRPSWLQQRQWLRAFPLAFLDIAIVIALALALMWYFTIFRKLESGSFFFMSSLDNYMALAGVICVLVVALRVFGPPLTIVGAFALSYGLYGENFPGMLQHAGYSFTEVMRVMWYSFDGVFGQPTSVVISMILIFIVFGTVLEGIGAGEVLLKMAFRLTGGLRGGAAHAAIVSSGLFGTISGSVAANVVGTGVFTIPMIRKQGFKGHFAGGIEAAASTGGQIMPPVMGAVAFIMADVTGIPYLQICLAALVPALFYYGSLFTAVTVQANKQKIPTIAKEDRPNITRFDWAMSLCFILPIITIVYMLLRGYSAAMAGFWATIIATIIGWLILWANDVRQLQAETRENNPREFWLRITSAKIVLRLLHIFARAGQACASILVAVGLVGIIIGVFNMTGLGLRFSNFVLDLAGSNLIIALVLMMLGSLILGMGVPTVPAYLMIVLVMGPAIQGLGLPMIAVHLFAVYFACLSFITPPVAIGAIVAAPIAQANPMATAMSAVKVAFVGFIIPYVFVFNTDLLIIVEDFSFLAFLWAVLRMLLAIWLIETGLLAFGLVRIQPLLQVLRIVIGLALIATIPLLQISALVIGISLLVWEFMQHRQTQSLAPS